MSWGSALSGSKIQILLCRVSIPKVSRTAHALVASTVGLTPVTIPKPNVSRLSIISWSPSSLDINWSHSMDCIGIFRILDESHKNRFSTICSCWLRAGLKTNASWLTLYTDLWPSPYVTINIFPDWLQCLMLRSDSCIRNIIRVFTLATGLKQLVHSHFPLSHHLLK